ncbi:dienelactone hydrolase family protein [Fertoebacter nigrum]|uniref:Dienelactone hydrolase family protein n=1 Tax=Fertoeibacter niger TaxID=2656921 RepID=A0A8X8H2U9_9RHOB|nr:dienelactone hydrolase family protein [Fertoeibacter niger]
MIRSGAKGAAAQAGLVLLHGRGGDAQDILGLLTHAALPDVAAVAPTAQGNSWWSSSFLAPSAQMEPHLARGLAVVRDAVAALEADGLPRSSIWLAGFSQGACLALEAFARDGDGLAGVFGFSGGLVGVEDAPGGADAALYGHGPKVLDYPGRRDGTAVWLSVHQRDPHIPLKRVEDTATALRAMGAGVQVQVYPGAGHAVMREDIAALRAALNRAHPAASFSRP